MDPHPEAVESMDRRDFIAQGFGVLALAGARAVDRGVRHTQARGQQRIRIGYAAITWGGRDRVAMDEISALGFRGIQLRASAVTEWGTDPAALRELLAARGLTLVALSSGLVRLDPAYEAEDLELHLRHARFVRDVGGLYLQVVDQRPTDRPATAEDYRRMGQRLTNLGRRTSDIGIALGYHNHMGNLGQAPHEVEQVLAASDPEFVKLELDTAHYVQAGGDPARAIRDHRDRLLFLHIKDVTGPVEGRGPESYRFVELGRGRVDFPAVFGALQDVEFSGWAVIELDSVPDPAGSPRASAEVSKRYIEETLGLRV